MKKIISIIIMGLCLTASAQYWTTNITVEITTNMVSQIVTDGGGGQELVFTPVVSSVTNVTITPIMVTNNVKSVLTAQATEQLRELFDTLKDDGQVTGTFNIWFDTTANEVVARALTSKAGELNPTKEARILRLWRAADESKQTNAVNILK